jgi:EF hand domain-containing protein
MTASMTRALLLAAAVFGAVAAGCTSTPFGNATDFDRTFIGAAQTWDLNKDGSVTCDEWKQYTTTLVRESDGNRDGALDATEFAAMAKSDRLFQVADLSYYDSNGDGRVSADELAGKQNLAFKLLDKNGDCQIDRNEAVQVVGNDKPKEAPKEVDQNIPHPGGGM